jgi:hypothetical protein
MAITRRHEPMQAFGKRLEHVLLGDKFTVLIREELGAGGADEQVQRVEETSQYK